MIKMPGKSYNDILPPLTEIEKSYRDQLKRDLKILGKDIGERNVFIPTKLNEAATFLETSFEKTGYTPKRQTFKVLGENVSNIEVEIKGVGKPEEIVIVGAHYDSILGSPGANDNGSGAVAILALSRSFYGKKMQRTLRFVEFVNEEPPFFQEYEEKGMGSWEYARRCRTKGENIVAMLSLETIGYFSDKPGSQKYPPPFNFFYPTTGNFIGFVGNISSRKLTRQAIGIFRHTCKFPSQGVATFGFIPGIGWSDHWSFWKEGYPAIMITDTAPYRYPYYHTKDDTIEKVDYDRLARVLVGLEKVIANLVTVSD
ncbi:MAG: M28 family peptidase [Desulfobacterales bacterium]|nr:M28 family peptidase [Desulfobacterales bacterium]